MELLDQIKSIDKDLLIFIIIAGTVCPTVLILVSYLFKNSITGFASRQLIQFAIVVAIICYVAGYAGAIHFWWIVPIGLTTMFFVIRAIYKKIHLPLKFVTACIQKMSNGDYHFDLGENEAAHRKDELGSLFLALKNLIESNRRKALFIKEVVRGDLNYDVDEFDQNDMQGQSLIALKRNLQSVLDETRNVVISAGIQGDLQSRISLEEKEGVWKELGVAINDLLISVYNPFRMIQDIGNKIASGDFTTSLKMEAKGDIKVMEENFNRSLDQMSLLLNGLASDISTVNQSSSEMLGLSKEMLVSTNEIATSIGEMSRGAQSQLQHVEHTSSLIAEIQHSANEIGNQSNQIHEAASNSAERSRAGLGLIQSVSDSMNDIDAFARATNQSIMELTNRTAEITSALGVINNISSQTNLLALNAAIEAAQAGDAGRGFSVVAEEIRKLAEDARKSVKVIQALVENVNRDTKATSSSLESLNKSIETGQDSSGKATEAFHQIADSTSETLGISKSILKAAETQVGHIREILDLTENVVVISEETATGSEEIASSTAQLSAGMNSHTEAAEEVVRISNDLMNKIAQFEFAKEDEDEAEEEVRLTVV